MESYIEFKKFKPKRSLSVHVQAVILQLVDFVPAGATISAYISKLKKKYQCLIQVITPSSRFVENVLAEDPDLAIDMVSERMKVEMQNWRLEQMAMDEPSFWDFKEVKT
jgi:hypothetical protein